MERELSGQTKRLMKEFDGRSIVNIKDQGIDDKIFYEFIENIEKNDVVTNIFANKNYITKLDINKLVEKFPKLEFINMEGNKISEIVDPINETIEKSKIRNISLSHNKITDISPIIKIKSLHSLLVEDNKIQSLPQDFNIDRNIINLSIGNNKIETVPNVSCMKYLCTKNNPIQYEEIENIKSNLRENCIFEYNMAYFDKIKSWQAVFKDLINDDALLKFVKNLKNDNLKNFISKIPLGHDRNIFQEGLRYIVKQLQNKETYDDMISEVSAQTGDCSTPIKDFTIECYVRSMAELGLNIDEKILSRLIISKAIKESNIIKGDGDHQEILESMIKFLTSSKYISGIESIDTMIASSYANHQWANNKQLRDVTKLFCKTGENNKLLLVNNKFLWDGEKYESHKKAFCEKYLTKDNALSIAAEKAYSKISKILLEFEITDIEDISQIYQAKSCTTQEIIASIKDAIANIVNENIKKNIKPQSNEFKSEVDKYIESKMSIIKEINDRNSSKNNINLTEPKFTNIEATATKENGDINNQYSQHNTYQNQYINNDIEMPARANNEGKCRESMSR